MEEGMQKLRQVELDDAMAEMKALSRQVAAAWTSPKSGVALVDEQRRSQYGNYPTFQRRALQSRQDR
jgi:hypothetical protein